MIAVCNHNGYLIASYEKCSYLHGFRYVQKYIFFTDNDEKNGVNKERNKYFHSSVECR